MVDRLIQVRVHDGSTLPPLHGICVGYERGQWRANQLVEHVVEWIPEFALTHREIQAIGVSNAVALVRKAARAIYTSKKFERRGELGELLLHAILREIKNTIPAVSKIYYKDSPNDTVKGFDAVHVIDAGGGDLELWLGEVKLYSDIGDAIRDVVAELLTHSTTNFLRTEFVAIINKIDPTWPQAEKLQLLLDPQTSLDAVFERVRVPVLLTYDSAAVQAHDAISAAYKADFETEIRKHHASFASRQLPRELHIELFLLPVHQKSELIDAFDRQLKAWQTI
ncbi:HamA C-terminal domain-containing protein [Polyangium jinanense]|uniref:DUF1837 domain-containing protein n=1 Tax=Polyangium jinanense TaxID=2829994 RepID=A0A9X3XJS6_9BACT|nr:DUF1837 domain-containing protein [Polyangium jinanense]MDC3962535.1 DUF1837 domain-containing protein [Polyangium jinanense]MDC3989356.1 DUF1837 domain-containing protein [Polyangium jinanense]